MPIWKTLFRRPHDATSPRPCFRPGLEALEDRRTPALTVPDPFKVQLTVVSPTQMRVEWQDATEETGYQVQRWDGDEWKPVGPVLAANVTGYTASGLIPNTVYYFTVKAFDDKESIQSEWAEGTTPIEPITAPGGLHVVATSTTTATARWANSLGETGYRIYRAVGTGWTLVGTTEADVTSFQFTGLQPAQSYFYYVQAFNGTNTANSGSAAVRTPAEAISAPKSVSLRAQSQTRIDITWSRATGQTGYRVYKWDGKQVTVLATLGAGATTCRATGLQAGKTYYFYVQAFNSTNAASTPWKSMTTQRGPALPAPGTVAAKPATPGSATLTWTVPRGAAGIRIYQSNGRTWRVIRTLPKTATKYEVTNLARKATHWFYVQAYTASGETSNSRTVFVRL